MGNLDPSFYSFKPIHMDKGCFEIGPGVRFYLHRKPNIFHRWMARLLLGWKWIDKE